MLIEEDKLRLVSMDGLPGSLRGRTADLESSLVGQLMRSGQTVMMATGSGEFDDLIWSALPGLQIIASACRTSRAALTVASTRCSSGRKVGHVELELLELMAGHASVALTNAMAFEELIRQRARRARRD